MKPLNSLSHEGDLILPALSGRRFAKPEHAIRAVLSGMCAAGIVRGVQGGRECNRQADLILSAKAAGRSEASKVPGQSLGPRLFEHAADPRVYFERCATTPHAISEVIGTAYPPLLLDVIRDFERLTSIRVRALSFEGRSAAYNSVLVFQSGARNLVGVHDDLANIRAFRTWRSHGIGIEIANTNMVLAHNLYLRNSLGEGSLYIYPKRFSDQEKIGLDEKLNSDVERVASQGLSTIATTGFEYPESEFSGAQPLIIDVAPGDYVVFRADFPHRVANRGDYTPGAFRLSWNGFFAPIKQSNHAELLYWT